MTEIAEKVFLSRSVASRLFKQTTGENFPDYLKKLRLTSVKRALEQTDLSITQIALESGFSSPSVLNRTFRESLGVSPTDYRKAYKEHLKQNTEEEKRIAGRYWRFFRQIWNCKDSAMKRSTLRPFPWRMLFPGNHGKTVF